MNHTFASRDDAERAAAALAAERGYVLASWHRISGRMFANMCLRCGALIFVQRPAGVRGGPCVVRRGRGPRRVVSRP